MDRMCRVNGETLVQIQHPKRCPNISEIPQTLSKKSSNSERAEQLVPSMGRYGDAAEESWGPDLTKRMKTGAFLVYPLQETLDMISCCRVAN
ncbi:MAG: hypothetical protein EBT92_17895 [Planctomycetes bacterium]|nr:hypothetical protein [Planctomycetota bacterium]